MHICHFFFSEFCFTEFFSSPKFKVLECLVLGYAWAVRTCCHGTQLTLRQDILQQNHTVYFPPHLKQLLHCRLDCMLDPRCTSYNTPFCEFKLWLPTARWKLDQNSKTLPHICLHLELLKKFPPKKQNMRHLPFNSGRKSCLSGKENKSHLKLHTEIS